MPTPPLYPLSYAPIIARALDEDFGEAGDLTTDSIVDPGVQASANIVARREGCLAGLDVALDVFSTLDPSITVERGHHVWDEFACGSCHVVAIDEIFSE